MAEAERVRRHLHRCQNCGVIWGHGELPCDLEAHKCPKCGKSEWRIYSGLKKDQPAPAKTAAVQGRTYYSVDLGTMLSMGLLAMAAILLFQVIADWFLDRA